MVVGFRGVNDGVAVLVVICVVILGEFEFLAVVMSGWQWLWFVSLIGLCGVFFFFFGSNRC